MLLIELSVYGVAIALASFLWRTPIVLALCYVVLSILVLWGWHKRSDLFFYSVAFVLGPGGEVIAVYFGAWNYAKPIFLIPIWLPLLWGVAAVCTKRFSETLLGER
jgi:hypothetical protein